MKGIGMRWVAAWICALLLACSNSHGANAGSSGSNWLKCEKLADCAGAKDAVACSDEGFCVDRAGERIAAKASGAGAGGTGGSTNAGSGEPIAAAGNSAPSGKCLWSVDELLAEVGSSANERRSCGQYGYWDSTSIMGAMQCFEDTVASGGAVEITINNCADCAILATYVSTPAGEHFVITRENDGFGGDNVSEATVQTCSAIDFELGVELATVSCASPEDVYHCSEPRDPNRDSLPSLPVTPLKLADLSSPGNVARETLHLYVSNQSFEAPLVNIDVMIDDVRVVTGDFAVEGQHSWHEFTILVPIGSHMLRASSLSNEAELEQAIDVPAERWAVVDYWNEGTPESEMFALTLHDQPVSFE